MTEEIVSLDNEFQYIRRKLRQACEDLLLNEKELFFTGVNERSITHCLAVRLEKLFDGMDVDCEYNRRGKVPKALNINKIKRLLKKEIESRENEPKEIQPEDTQATTVYPDIIIHKRCVDNHNLLVIEAKKDAPLGQVPEADEAKLIGFTSQGEFNYRFGAFVNFRIKQKPYSCRIHWYEEGRPTEEVDAVPQENS